MKRRFSTIGHMPTDPIILIIFTLAIARITGMITVDKFSESTRDKIVAWLDDRPGSMGYYLAYLITCQWCASIYVSASVVPLMWFHGSNPIVLMPAVGLAAAQVTGMMSEIGR